MSDDTARDQFVYGELVSRLEALTVPVEDALPQVIAGLEDDAAALFPWLSLDHVPGFRREADGSLNFDVGASPLRVTRDAEGRIVRIAASVGNEWGSLFEAMKNQVTALTPEDYEAGMLELAAFVCNTGSREVWAATTARATAKLKELSVPRPENVVKGFLGKEPPRPPADEEGAGTSLGGSVYEHIEPWPDPVDGAALLDDLATFVAGPALLPPGAATAMALYAVMTYLREMLEICPYLAFTSPTMRAGKSRAQDLMSFVVFRPLPTVNCTPAAIFRELDANHPTLLIDEAETFLGDEELRGILNGGYNRGRPVLRAVPSPDGGFETKQFDAFGPKVFGLIGKLPATLQDRSIVVPMQRKRSGEGVESFRRRQVREYRQRGNELARRVLRWVADHYDEVEAVEPAIPAGLDDRAADNWEPLLSIADVAGGDWPDRARRAAVVLSVMRDEKKEDEKVLLLADCRRIFRERGEKPIDCTDLASNLWSLEERPWAEYGRRGLTITTDRVGKMLGEFGIKSKPVRVPGQNKTRREYRAESFADAWERHGIGPDDEEEAE